jgi:hypothetical protein
MDIRVFVCVNVSERRRGAQPVCGQLWTHEGGQMTATSTPIEVLRHSREEVALSGNADALTWRHAFEISDNPDYPRRGQRIIVCPKFLDKLDSILRQIKYTAGGGRMGQY